MKPEDLPKWTTKPCKSFDAILSLQVFNGVPFNLVENPNTLRPEAPAEIDLKNGKLNIKMYLLTPKFLRDLADHVENFGGVKWKKSKKEECFGSEQLRLE